MNNLVFIIDKKRHPVYSLYDPVRDGERFHRESFSDGSDFYIMIGFGLGYQIKPFVENTAVRKIVVLEPVEDLWNEKAVQESVAAGQEAVYRAMLAVIHEDLEIGDSAARLA